MLTGQVSCILASGNIFEKNQYIQNIPKPGVQDISSYYEHRRFLLSTTLTREFAIKIRS